MTTEEKARAYDEALTTAKRIISKNCSEVEKLCLKCIFPTLSESEDERIRKRLIEYFEGFRIGNTKVKWEGLTVQDVLAWLEKQKYDRMQPIYDNQESFESALDKAWNSYNDSGVRTVDGCEDNYTECAHAKGFREGYLFGLQKQKDLDKMIVVSPEVWDKAINDAYENGKKDGKKQKEQKPAEHSAKGRRGRMGGIPEYVRRKAEAFRNKMEPPYDADDICTAYEAGALESAKPAWSEEDEDAINGAIGIILDDNNPNFVFPEHSKLSVGEIVKRLKSLRPSWKPSTQELGALKTAVSVLTKERTFPKAAEQIQKIIDVFDGKELRKDWKPSEEQMEWLESAVKLSTDKPHIHGIIISLYEQLKRLM